MRLAARWQAQLGGRVSDTRKVLARSVPVSPGSGRHSLHVTIHRVTTAFKGVVWEVRHVLRNGKSAITYHRTKRAAWAAADATIALWVRQ